LQAANGSLSLIWKKNSQLWTARCGDRCDPQPVKRSSE